MTTRVSGLGDVGDRWAVWLASGLWAIWAWATASGSWTAFTPTDFPVNGLPHPVAAAAALAVVLFFGGRRALALLLPLVPLVPLLDLNGGLLAASLGRSDLVLLVLNLILGTSIGVAALWLSRQRVWPDPYPVLIATMAVGLSALGPGLWGILWLLSQAEPSMRADPSALPLALQQSVLAALVTTAGLVLMASGHRWLLRLSDLFGLILLGLTAFLLTLPGTAPGLTPVLLALLPVLFLPLPVATLGLMLVAGAIALWPSILTVLPAPEPLAGQMMPLVATMAIWGLVSRLASLRMRDYLARSGADVRHLLRMTDSGRLTVDPDKGLVHADPDAAQLLGLPREFPLQTLLARLPDTPDLSEFLEGLALPPAPTERIRLQGAGAATLAGFWRTPGGRVEGVVSALPATTSP
ncbi:hypothetical protein AB0T83_14695 [Fluviibacterium sp. DFM31]|uniref:PAS domain-containing protein n=1 Tax=Meridianimarinicoccus marinus TaxID=3231483 RepID=A0ABV3L962_9RHOB